VIEFTPGGTVKLCAAPVKEKLHVTVLAASEQPDGNAAAAEPTSVNHPKLMTPTIATDRQTPAQRTRDENQPTTCAAPKVTATNLHAAGLPWRTINGRNVTHPRGTSNLCASLEQRKNEAYPQVAQLRSRRGRHVSRTVSAAPRGRKARTSRTIAFAHSPPTSARLHWRHFGGRAWLGELARPGDDHPSLEGRAINDPPEGAASGRDREAVRGRYHRRWAFVDGVDDLGVIDSAQVHRRDRKVGVLAELALDDEQRHSLARHLDGMSVPQLMVVPTSAQAPLCRPPGYAD
jgi:hypothetical protein